MAALHLPRWRKRSAQWLEDSPVQEPIGVCFSGGIDSGSVFLTTYHVMRKLGMNPSRLKAFVLDLGDGPDLEQARILS